MRLDNYIVEKTGLTKNKSQALIKAWAVLINNKKITKAWYEIKESDSIEISHTDESKYVARSAIKLKKYFEKNSKEVQWKVALDIGSSTGWFCQILLENGIKKIYWVDVWSSQLHESLKSNSKIVSIENTDIRKLEKLSEEIDIITCDVSFIPLSMILESIISHCWKNTEILLLFKPQFEVWKNNVNKKWVVKHEKYTTQALNNFLNLCREKWLKIVNVEKSQLHWENGNEEIFIEWIRKDLTNK